MTQSGMVVIEMTSKEYEAIKLLHGVKETAEVPIQKVYPSHEDAVCGVSGDQMTLKEAADYCAPRLLKLAPKKKTGVLNGLRAMFNFQGGVSDGKLDEIYRTLQGRGVFKECNGKIVYQP